MDEGHAEHVEDVGVDLSIWAGPIRNWVTGGKYPPSLRSATMTQYLLSVHSVAAEAGDPMTADPMTPEQMQQSMQQVYALQEEMKSAGAWLFGGRLTEPDTATVVRMSGGEVMTTDGPFVEAKEHLGGFYIVEAEDLDAALGWAAKTTAIIGAPIEVRPFWDEPGA
jgi:hypothetical protein